MTMIGEIDSFTKEDMLACVPRLRTFARSLTRNREQAEDLLQDTIVRAMAASRRFQSGTNLKAWMFTILRNLHYTEMRKAKLRTHLSIEEGQHVPTVPGNQESSLDFSEFRQALTQISEEQRDALMMVGAGGFTYAEAAETYNCPIGTIKSRVSRARIELRRILEDGHSIGENEAFVFLPGSLGVQAAERRSGAYASPRHLNAAVAEQSKGHH